MRLSPSAAWDKLEGYLNAIPEEDIKNRYLTFHRHQKDQAVMMPGGLHGHHHSWPGGYAVHIYEVVSNGWYLRGLPTKPKDFSETDLIIATYTHDLDKLLYRYEVDRTPPTEPQRGKCRGLGIHLDTLDTLSTASQKIDAAMRGEKLDAERLSIHSYREGAMAFDDSAIVLFLCNQHNLPMTEQALHAISLHHGGYSALARTSSRIKVSMLASLVHAADYISANAQRGDIEYPDETIPAHS